MSKLTFESCAALFAKARNKSAGKLLANNTRLMQVGECYAVRLHQTDILTFRPDGAVRYDSGGWRTVTTKARMNEFGPARVWSEKGAWYIGNGAQSSPYMDGCTVHPDGMSGVGDADAVQAENKLRKAAGAYAKAYVSALFAGDIGTPGAGDCWGCLMKATDGTRPLGGESHMRGHFEEKYFVPSLVWNALEFQGAGDAYKYAVQELQRGRDPGGFYGSMARERLPRMIRRFCLKELGLSY